MSTFRPILRDRAGSGPWRNTNRTLKIVHDVRAVDKDIPLLLDTKGPEIRTTKGDKPVVLQEGLSVKVLGNPHLGSTQEVLCVSHDAFAVDVPVGTRILIDDGGDRYGSRSPERGLQRRGGRPHSWK